MRTNWDWEKTHYSVFIGGILAFLCLLSLTCLKLIHWGWILAPLAFLVLYFGLSVACAIFMAIKVYDEKE